MPVEHVSFRRVSNLPDSGMPQDLATTRIVSDYAATDVAGKDESARSSQNAVATAAAPEDRIFVLPCDLAGFVVDRSQITANGCDRLLVLAAKTHGAARVGLGQIVHRVVV